MTGFLHWLACNSAGIPVLLPLAAASLAIGYMVEKFQVRVYSPVAAALQLTHCVRSCMATQLFRVTLRPPRYNEQLATMAARLMPYGALIHLIIGVFMYGDPDVVSADKYESTKLLRRISGGLLAHTKLVMFLLLCCV